MFASNRCPLSPECRRANKNNSLRIPPRHVTARLLQINSHRCRTENDRYTNLYSSQFEDDAVRILKPRYLCAAARKPNGYRSIGAGDVCRSPQIVRRAHQLGARYPNGAEADLRDVKPISLPL
jgi:hypothetical protein